MNPFTIVIFIVVAFNLVGVPYAYLSNDMLMANYSNSRLALLEFRRRIDVQIGRLGAL